MTFVCLLHTCGVRDSSKLSTCLLSDCLVLRFSLYLYSFVFFCVVGFHKKKFSSFRLFLSVIQLRSFDFYYTFSLIVFAFYILFVCYRWEHPVVDHFGSVKHLQGRAEPEQW